MIISIEGPSAVGKTTLMNQLESAAAGVVPELAGFPPPGPDEVGWFVNAHAEQWSRARQLERHGAMVVMDGDPCKGIWWSWIYEGPRALEKSLALHARAFEEGRLSFADLYVVLCATESELHARRTSDSTRRRRNFERHLQLVEPQWRYFQEMRRLDVDRVLLLDTSRREELPEAVMSEAENRAGSRRESMVLLNELRTWLREHPAAGVGSRPNKRLQETGGQPSEHSATAVRPPAPEASR